MTLFACCMDVKALTKIRQSPSRDGRGVEVAVETTRYRNGTLQTFILVIKRGFVLEKREKKESVPDGST